MNLGYEKNGFLWNSENTKSRFEMEWKEESFFHVRRYESFFYQAVLCVVRRYFIKGYFLYKWNKRCKSFFYGLLENWSVLWIVVYFHLSNSKNTRRWKMV
jgi:hypothetical protein